MVKMMVWASALTSLMVVLEQATAYPPEGLPSTSTACTTVSEESPSGGLSSTTPKWETTSTSLGVPLSPPTLIPPPNSPPVTSEAMSSSTYAPLHATAVSTTIIQDGVTKPVVVLTGGPLTAPITLPPQEPGKLDPSGIVVQSSLSDILADAGSILPAVSSWIAAPDAAKVTPAVQAVETFVPVACGLVNNLANSELSTECQHPLLAENLEHAANNLCCKLLGLLGGLEAADQVTIAAPQLASLAASVSSEVVDINSQIGIITSLVGGGSVPPGQTPTLVGPPVIPTISITTSSTTAAAVTITTLPPEATFITLSDNQYTSPVYITTTSPGGHDPTIVPGEHKWRMDLDTIIGND